MSFFKKIKIKEDRRKRYIIIILLLLIVLIGLGVFLNKINDSKSKKYQSFESEKKANNEKDVIEEEDVEQEEEFIEDDVDLSGYEKEVEFYKKNCEEKELKITKTGYEKIYEDLYELTYIKSRPNGYSSFSDNEIFAIGFAGMKCSDYSVSKEKMNEVSFYYEFSGDTYVESLKKYFGNNISFDKNKLVEYQYNHNKVILPDSCKIVKSYDKNTDKYKVFFGGIGGTGGPGASVIRRKLVDFKNTINEVIYVEKVIYVDKIYTDIGVKYTIYSDPEKKNILDIKEYTLEEAVNITISVDDYLDKAATITHKIKLDKNTNNYYFVSSVIE